MNATGRHIRMKGPLHLKRSLRKATATKSCTSKNALGEIRCYAPVRTVAGTYGGTNINICE